MKANDNSKQDKQPNPGKLTAQFINSGGELVSFDDIVREVRKKRFLEKLRLHTSGKKRFFFPIILIALVFVEVFAKSNQSFSENFIDS